MASFAGNIAFKISCNLPSRVFPIPRNRTIWKIQIACLKSRGFSSSVPVRYLANTPSRVKSPGNCGYPDVSVPKINGGKDVHATITYCETSHNPDEIHTDLLFDDNEEGSEQMEEVGELTIHQAGDSCEQDFIQIDKFTNDVEESAIKLLAGSEQMEEVGELTIHQAGDSCEQDFIQIDKFTNDVEESAIKLLAVRALTAVELRKKLLGKRFSPNAVEAVINKFQRRGLINDRLYAESFSQSRWSSSSWGPRRIKQALFKKGVSQADAEKAVEVVFNDNDCAGDHKSVIGLSKHAMDHLYAQASKQWFRGQNVAKETRKSRIVRWLQYRGFDWNVINIILKKLDSQEQNPP